MRRQLSSKIEVAVVIDLDRIFNLHEVFYIKVDLDLDLDRNLDLDLI